jgi:hypothetical protein
MVHFAIGGYTGIRFRFINSGGLAAISGGFSLSYGLLRIPVISGQ